MTFGFAFVLAMPQRETFNSREVSGGPLRVLGLVVSGVEAFL